MLRYSFVLLVYFLMNLSSAASRDAGVIGTRRGQVYVQVAARNDEQAASLFSASFKERYGRIVGEQAISVRRVDLGEKVGWPSEKLVWYRVLIGPVERGEEADLLCERLKGAGLKGCFVRADEQ